MSEWKTVRLGDVCEIAAGQGAPQGDSNYCNDGTPFVKAGNLIELIEGKHENQIQKVSEEVAKSHKLKKYSAGSILFAKSGMSCMKGYVYQLKNDSYVVSHLAIVKPKEDSSNYIEYCLRHIKPNTLVKDEAYPSISLQDISNIQIPLPPLEEQKHIANVLDKCTVLIAKYKKMLAKYDTLIKSRFIEMFGDPVQNPMGWKVKPMGDLLSVLTDFSANGSYKTLDSNVIMYDEPNYALMIRTTDLESGDFRNNVKWVDEKAYNLLSKSKIYGKEIIMNKIGSAGKVYLMPELNIPVTLGRNAFLFRYKENINSVYIYFLLTSEYGQNEIKPYIRGAVTKTITKDDVRKIRIPVPPLTLQNNFATFVHQIDKSKFEYTYTGVAA